MNADDYKAGFRAGFEAGKTHAASATFPVAVVPTVRPPRIVIRRCLCGHAASTHNDLGYCQAKRDRSDMKNSDGCYCEGYQEKE